MRYRALASDYDGTLATAGAVADATIEALERLRRSGRRLVLVTGRLLPDLEATFPRLDLCDRVVAENGGVLHVPGERRTAALAPPPDPRFLAALRERGVPFTAGEVIVATEQPHDQQALAAIRDLGLDLHIVFNKGAVMILPAGVSKATGLEAALRDLGLSTRNVVGVGDAENDHAFLERCELSAAVGNALPAVREHADLLLDRADGAGVAELVDRLLADDLAGATTGVERLRLSLGADARGGDVTIPPSSHGFLIAGPSASGKSTLATAFIEQLARRGYQLCVIDPEGDYERLAGAAVVGDPDRQPAVTEVLRLLEQAGQDVVVNLLGVPMDDRPDFLAGLLPALLAVRKRTGRPHWLVIDEAHHVLPEAKPGLLPADEDLPGLVLLTVHPDRVAADVLRWADGIVVFGGETGEAVAAFAAARGVAAPAGLPGGADGEVLGWWRDGEPFRFRPLRPRGERQRHLRKYLRGDLGPSSFVFTGPAGALGLLAQNLLLFLQIGEGVDEATWDFHRRRHDYSRWLREQVKDHALAADVERIEDGGSTTDDARRQVRRAVEARYTV
jgi:hydroxymethylpyrimidine pyrophosphatase-like HAD family hydrolase